MSTERRYNEDEVARILESATQAEASDAPAPVVADEAEGMTLAELQEIGSEVGIDPSLIADAATALERPGVTAPTRYFLGTPIAVGRTVELDRKLTDREWERLIVDLRETFDARGKIRQEGNFRQWTNGNLQALLEPTPTGERLRLRTLKGEATTMLGMGAAVLVLAPLLFVILALSGGLGDPGTLRVALILTLIGGSMFAASKLSLPGWADLRQLQMDGVASRLVDQMAEADRRLPAGSADEPSED